jgi:DNA-binding transcriptional LysR family regulator
MMKRVLARSLDIVISIGDAFKSFHRRQIYTDSDALAVRRGHPVGARLKNAETFFKARHVAVVIRGQSVDLIDEWLRTKGLERPIALVVPSYIEAAHRPSRVRAAPPDPCSRNAAQARNHPAPD